MTIKIGYDAGHGGSNSTPGKRTPDNEYEWGFNNTVAKAFAEELSKYEGIELKRFDDATGKKDIVLRDRTKAINAWGADYHISFHHNANTGKWGNWGGVETFIYLYPSVKQINLAKALHGALVKGYGLKDRGVKKQDLAICRDIKKGKELVGILLEGGFMDSTTDIHVLRDTAKLKNAGVLIAQALANYLKLTLKKKEGATVTVPQSNPISFLNETGRTECKEMIKRGVEEKLFTSKHEKVDSYSDSELLSYALAYVNRKTKKI